MDVVCHGECPITRRRVSAEAVGGAVGGACRVIDGTGYPSCLHAARAVLTMYVDSMPVGRQVRTFVGAWYTP